MSINKDYLVEKRNILNEVRANSMTLQELRFFSIYLAKINPRDPSTRVVRFTLLEFQKIMDTGKLNLAQLRNSVDSLLCKVVGVPLKTGGFTRFQLFKEATFTTDENHDWYIEIDANDKALPLMFEFKDRYFTYELWNALKLKSANQLRMYELLKQFEKIGERTLTVDVLKELLGIKPDEYPRFGDFKNCVLDVCQKALAIYTDLKYEYEPTGKKGKGGKILSVKFTIMKNSEYIDQLTLAKFFENEDTKPDSGSESQSWNKNLAFFAEACNNEFSEVEVQLLYNLITKLYPYQTGKKNELEWFNYLKHKYDELNWRHSSRPIKKRFAYLKKIIETDYQTASNST